MSATDSPLVSTPSARDDRHVRLGWACLLSAPILLVLSIVLGYGLADGRGRVPALVLTVIAAVFVGVNLIQWVMGMILGG